MALAMGWKCPGSVLGEREHARAARARVDLGIEPPPTNVAASREWRATIEAIPRYDTTYPSSWRSEGLGARVETS